MDKQLWTYILCSSQWNGTTKDSLMTMDTCLHTPDKNPDQQEDGDIT